MPRFASFWLWEREEIINLPNTGVSSLMASLRGRFDRQQKGPTGSEGRWIVVFPGTKRCMLGLENCERLRATSFVGVYGHYFPFLRAALSLTPRVGLATSVPVHELLLGAFQLRYKSFSNPICEITRNFEQYCARCVSWRPLTFGRDLPRVARSRACNKLKWRAPCI